MAPIQIANACPACGGQIYVTGQAHDGENQILCYVCGHVIARSSMIAMPSPLVPRCGAFPPGVPERAGNSEPVSDLT